jgi:hypothetical protein
LTPAAPFTVATATDGFSAGEAFFSAAETLETSIASKLAAVQRAGRTWMLLMVSKNDS